MKDFELDKNVIVSVKGTQTVGEMSDSMEVTTTGIYAYKNGVSYITYEEYDEETKKPIKNMIKVLDEKIELVKRGEYNVNMIFGKGEENLSYYSTPFGQILVGIMTESMEVRVDDGIAQITIKYRLTMNGEYASDNEIQVTVRKDIYGS